MSLLRLTGVACRRGGRLLFEGLDLVLEPGDAALVTGPNGAGKSSLLRLAARLLPPAAGTVEAAPAALADARTPLDAELPLARALAWWGEVRLADWDLDALADVPVRFLSTGQHRRAALARSAAAGRPLWLLDEPANGLDTASTHLLAAKIAHFRGRGGAVMIATHVPVALPGAVEVRL